MRRILVKQVERAAFRSRAFRFYHIRSLLRTGCPDQKVLITITPLNPRSPIVAYYLTSQNYRDTL